MAGSIRAAKVNAREAKVAEVMGAPGEAVTLAAIHNWVGTVNLRWNRE